MSEMQTPVDGAVPRAIADVYAQVQAPQRATPDPGALLGVLRDLSWLDEGPVTVRVPSRSDLDDAAMCRLVHVLMTAEAETAHAARPVRVIVG